MTQATGCGRSDGDSGSAEDKAFGDHGSRRQEDVVVTAPGRDGQSKRRLALFLDGTWNAVGDNTNVWRLKSLCAPFSKDGAEQVTYYDVGVNGFFGGMVGKGPKRKCRRRLQMADR